MVLDSARASHGGSDANTFIARPRRGSQPRTRANGPGSTVDQRRSSGAGGWPSARLDRGGPSQESYGRHGGAVPLLAEQDDEWQAADRAYFSQASMARLAGGEEPPLLIKETATR